MNTATQWWTKPRTVSVVVDNPSWIIPFAEELVEKLNEDDDRAMLCYSQEEVQDGDIAFYLGCIKITPPGILIRNRRNLVVHASDLPKGRGFSPLTWQVIGGKNKIPVCLLEATDEVDAGPVVDQQEMCFRGHELIDEMRGKLGDMHIILCCKYMKAPEPPFGRPQLGESTQYPRRGPSNSRLYPERSIAEQFDLLRTVDNEKYPAFFNFRGHRYKLAIEKMDKVANDS